MENIKKILVPLAAFLTIISGITFITIAVSYPEMKESDFTQINATIQEYYVYNRRKNDYIKIKTKEYNADFRLHSTALWELDRSAFLENIKKGDNITLSIRKEDLSNLGNNDFSISMYGIRDWNHEYVSPAVIIKSRQDSLNFALFMGYIFLIADTIVLTFLALIRINRKTQANKKEAQ